MLDTQVKLYTGAVAISSFACGTGYLYVLISAHQVQFRCIQELVAMLVQEFAVTSARDVRNFILSMIRLYAFTHTTPPLLY
jgi:hypothetical protein